MVKNKQVGQNGHAVDIRKHQNGSTKEASVGVEEKTDIYRWRLQDERGCQTWHYLGSDEEIKAWPQSIADKYFLGLPLVRFTAKSLVEFQACHG